MLFLRFVFGLLHGWKRGVTWALSGSLKTSRADQSSQKSIAVVQPRNDKGLDKKLCSMLCQKGPDLSDVV